MSVSLFQSLLYIAASTVFLHHFLDTSRFLFCVVLLSRLSIYLQSIGDCLYISMSLSHSYKVEKLSDAIDAMTDCLLSNYGSIKEPEKEDRHPFLLLQSLEWPRREINTSSHQQRSLCERFSCRSSFACSICLFGRTLDSSQGRKANEEDFFLHIRRKNQYGFFIFYKGTA